MSAVERASEVIKRVPQGVGAEIGIWLGKMSYHLLKSGLKLYMVDNWKGVPGYGHKFSDEAQIINKQKALELTSQFDSRRIILHMDSKDASLMVPDKSLDFVFIDADHSYEGVKSDIKHWISKVKPGGWLGGHDYGNENEPNHEGVEKAVNEASQEYGFKFEVPPHHCWFAKLE